jgi:hypothetical protein
MVRSRLPERVVALHPLIADQNILHCIVKGMPHVKLSRDIWGRDHDRKGFLCPIHFRVKILLFQPSLIDPILDALRIVGFCQFFSCRMIHILLLLLSAKALCRDVGKGLHLYFYLCPLFPKENHSGY